MEHNLRGAIGRQMKTLLVIDDSKFSEAAVCLGALALRPSGFVSMLDQMIREIALNDFAVAVAAGG